jgi:hypothetical protein
MNLVDTNLLFAAVDAVVNLNPAVSAYRKIELRNLISLRQIGIKVVLSVKLIVLSNLTVESKTGTNCELYNLFVHYRESTGHTGTNFANMGVWLAAKLGRTITKNLSLSGKLGMNFQTANSNKIHINLPP